MNDSREIYRVSFGNKKNHISDVFWSGNHLPTTLFLGPGWSHAGPTWSLRCPDSLCSWEGARGNTPPMPIRPDGLDFRRNKKKHIHHQPQSKSNNFHPILSRVHISEAILLSHVSKSCWETKQPRSPQLSASNSSPGQRKNSNFACKNGNLQSSFPEHKSKPLKITCQKRNSK